MQYSTDGGVTWQPVALPAKARLLHNWFVDASGLLYVTADDPGRKQAFVASIQRYDPADQQWSTLAVPSADGFLLAVTSTVSNGGDLLWFERLDGTLYRGTL